MKQLLTGRELSLCQQPSWNAYLLHINQQTKAQHQYYTLILQLKVSWYIWYLLT